jgi:nucleotide-binding universal stress UspA family protein
MTRLLVATDLSERTRIAERRAALIARGKGWDIDLVHAVDDDQPPAVVEAHRAAAASMLSETCARLAAESGHPCAPRIVLGDPSEALAAAAGAEDDAAIVLGPHRRRLIRDIFLGTTGERVIRAATVPVLCVHAEPAAPYRRMLLALDGSAASALVADSVRRLGLVDARDVTATLVADVPPTLMLRRSGASAREIEAAEAAARRTAQAELAAALPAAGFYCAREVLVDPDRSVPDALIAAAQRLGCDVIALGTRGRGGLESLVLGSVAASVLARARVDVLVAPPIAA